MLDLIKKKINEFKRPTVGLVKKNPRFGRISSMFGRGK